MQFPFTKYQGTGNDFVIIDNRALRFPKEDVSLIEKICTRRFGVGADGLMLVENADGYAFRMVYYNADGRQSTMCGNGGRCIAAFAVSHGIAPQAGQFVAIDGPHDYSFTEEGQVQLKMIDVSSIERIENDLIMNTGSPHFVRFTTNVAGCDMVQIGRSVRYSDRFKDGGINVNVVELGEDHAQMRTYERGVEDETYSCGTGTVAVALSVALKKEIHSGTVAISTRGGALKVHFQREGNEFKEIYLEGPATKVYSGVLETDLFGS
jgi:diaminopimelate epimerase